MAPIELDVLTLGEALVLFAAETSGSLAEVERFARYSAGAELNVAIGLARLGLRVGYLSRFGADAFGDYLRHTLEREGVLTELISTVEDRMTGFMLKGRTSDGSDSQIEYRRRGSAASAMNARDVQRLENVRARHLHLTGISPALSAGCRELAFEALRWARRCGMSVSFDPNLRPRLWSSRDEMVSVINQLAALSDLVLPGLEEGRQLTGRVEAPEIAAYYLARGASQVAIKLGRDGAWCRTRQEAGCLVPGVPVPRVVDTVGAGDGFAVGVVSALLEGQPLPAAVRRGNRIGARVVQFPGDSDGLPHRGELDEN